MSILAHARANVSRSRSTFVACLAFAFATGGAAVRAAGAADPGKAAAGAEGMTLAVLKPRYISADTAAILIKPALSHQAQVSLDNRTAVVIVSDLAENMEKARLVLQTVEEAVEAREAASKAASQPASQPAAAVNADVDENDPELTRILETHQTYQAYKQRLDEMATDVFTQRVGPEHPKAKAMRAKMAALQQQLADVREEIRGSLVADRVAAARTGAGAFGVGVSKAAEVVSRHLKLPRGAGLVIDRVAPGTPAEAAGLMPYDVLVRLDGQLLVNGEQLDVLLASLEPGKDVQVELFRDGDGLVRTLKVPTPATTKPAP